MGHNMARFLQRKRVAVLMLGLENSGKTTILYKLLTGERILPVPTFGFNMEILPFDDIELDVMDVGGDERIVPLWKHYLTSASALIYVLDCCDVNRMEENKVLLADIVSRPERKGVPLLVIVNKTDSLGYELSTDDLQLRLDLQMSCKLRPYKVQMVSAETGDGLTEAFTWLCATLGSGNASKKLKRIREKMARKEKEAVINKRRKTDSLSDEAPSDDELNIDVVEDEQSTTKKPVINPLPTTDAEDSVDVRTFSFTDSYDRVNAFFKTKADEIGLMMSGGPKTPTQPENPPEPADDRVQFGNAVDTLSSNPHKPMSPRRFGSMMRLQEFVEKRNLAKARVEAKRKEASMRSEPAPSPKKLSFSPGPQTAEFTFSRLFSYFSRNSSVASQTDEEKQSSLPSPSRAAKSYEINEEATRSTSLPHLKHRNVAVSKSNSVYWKERHRKRMSVDGGLDGSSTDTTIQEETLDEQPKSPPSPAKSLRPAILSVLASIRLSFGSLRRGSKDGQSSHENSARESPVKIGNSVFHVAQDASTASARPPLIELQPPSPSVEER